MLDRRKNLSFSLDKVFECHYTIAKRYRLEWYETLSNQHERDIK